MELRLISCLLFLSVLALLLSYNTTSREPVEEVSGTCLFNSTSQLLLEGNNNLNNSYNDMHNRTIGDYVWHDLNYNGIQDEYEPGIAEVHVVLINGTTGSSINETVTDNQGGYLFKDLSPGDYVIMIDATTLPSNYTSTTPKAVDDNSIDSDGISDVDGNGTIRNFICSDSISLNVTEDNYTIDFGFVAKPRGPIVPIKVNVEPNTKNGLELKIWSKNDSYLRIFDIYDGKELTIPAGKYCYNIYHTNSRDDIICEGTILTKDIGTCLART